MRVRGWRKKEARKREGKRVREKYFITTYAFHKEILYDRVDIDSELFFCESLMYVVQLFFLSSFYQIHSTSTVMMKHLGDCGPSLSSLLLFQSRRRLRLLLHHLLLVHLLYPPPRRRCLLPHILFASKNWNRNRRTASREYSLYVRLTVYFYQFFFSPSQVFHLYSRFDRSTATQHFCYHHIYCYFVHVNSSQVLFFRGNSYFSMNWIDLNLVLHSSFHLYHLFRVKICCLHLLHQLDSLLTWFVNVSGEFVDHFALQRPESGSLSPRTRDRRRCRSIHCRRENNFHSRCIQMFHRVNRSTIVHMGCVVHNGLQWNERRGNSMKPGGSEWRGNKKSLRDSNRCSLTLKCGFEYIFLWERECTHIDGYVGLRRDDGQSTRKDTRCPQEYDEGSYFARLCVDDTSDKNYQSTCSPVNGWLFRSPPLTPFLHTLRDSLASSSFLQSERDAGDESTPLVVQSIEVLCVLAATFIHSSLTHQLARSSTTTACVRFSPRVYVNVSLSSLLLPSPRLSHTSHCPVGSFSLFSRVQALSTALQQSACILCVCVWEAKWPCSLNVSL